MSAGRQKGATLLVVLALAGCAPPPLVRFDVPARIPAAAEYEDVRTRWARREMLRTDVDTAIDATAVLMSEEVRAAYINKLVDMRRLTEVEQGALRDEQRQAGEHYVEVVLSMVTSRWEWNDLSSPRSHWTLTLVDDRGQQAGRPEIAQWPERRPFLETMFPPWTPFTRVWRVRFHRQLSDGKLLLTPDTRRITLRIAGPLGATEMKWEAGR